MVILTQDWRVVAENEWRKKIDGAKANKWGNHEIQTG